MNRKCHSRKRSNTTLWLLIGVVFIWSNVNMGEVGSEALEQAQAPLLSQNGPTESENSQSEAPPAQPEKRSLLPSFDQLLEAKTTQLNAKLEEQGKVLANVELALSKEQALEAQTFDDLAYLSMSIFNTTPAADYKLESTEIYIDGNSKPVSQGGERNQGLPRNNEKFFFAPLSPGCHEVVVKAKFIRLKNDLISRFKMKREELVVRRQVIMAKSGYHIELDIETFLSRNDFIKLYQNPDIRFNRSVRANFLPGAPLVSMGNILNQGQVRIEYVGGDLSQHRLIDKSLSIDGLPVLTKKAHDEASESNIVFQAPLSEGKHTLNVVLLFGEKARIGGGPTYNFRLTFEREFFVRSGNTTLVNLVAMPAGGSRPNPRDSRYARVSTKITSEEEAEFFPLKSCRELRALELERQKALAPVAVEPPKAEPAPEPAPAEETGEPKGAPAEEIPEKVLEPEVPQEPKKAEPEVSGE